MYQISQIAQLAGISTKTLRHYEKLGLLVPRKADNGYRYYEEADLDRLQVILFYKYLDFPLRKIAQLLQEREEELLSHLMEQLTLLEAKQDHLDQLLTTLRKTIKTYQGGHQMSTEEKFAGFVYEDYLKHQDKAVEAYGQEVIDQAMARQKGQEDQMTQGFNQVFESLAQNLAAGLAHEDEGNQIQVDQLYQLINRYAFDCSLEVFGYIGQGYVANPDFQANIDRFAPGLAAYTAEIIQIYVKTRS